MLLQLIDHFDVSIKFCLQLIKVQTTFNSETKTKAHYEQGHMYLAQLVAPKLILN